MKKLIPGIFCVMLCIFAGSAKAQPSCKDILAILSDKPEFVELLQCTQDNDAQGKPFVARYRVKGSDALKAEQYMSQSFGLPKLQYICCGWDSTFYFYRDQETNLGYTLGMGSEETPVNDRDLWAQIKFFYINVFLFTEDP